MDKKVQKKVVRMDEQIWRIIDSLLRLKAASSRFDANWPAHHQLPLDHTWLDDYLGCTEKILSGAPADGSQSSSLGSGLVMKHKRIAVIYRPDRL